MVNLGRAIPSFAIIALVFPFSIRYGFGLGFWPTCVALVALGIPPMFTNAYSGVMETRNDIVEAASGIGMTGPQVLRKVELPAAVPLLMTGVRVSAVQIIATATLGALVGYECLGTYIVAGLARGPTGRPAGARRSDTRRRARAHGRRPVEFTRTGVHPVAAGAFGRTTVMHFVRPTNETSIPHEIPPHPNCRTCRPRARAPARRLRERRKRRGQRRSTDTALPPTRAPPQAPTRRPTPRQRIPPLRATARRRPTAPPKEPATSPTDRTSRSAPRTSARARSWPRSTARRSRTPAIPCRSRRSAASATSCSPRSSRATSTSRPSTPRRRSSSSTESLAKQPATSTRRSSCSQAQLEPLGLVAFAPAPAVDSNSFVVTAEKAEELGLENVSDLTDDLTLGGPPDCPDNASCIPGLHLGVRPRSLGQLRSARRWRTAHRRRPRRGRDRRRHPVLDRRHHRRQGLGRAQRRQGPDQRRQHRAGRRRRNWSTPTATLCSR